VYSLCAIVIKTKDRPVNSIVPDSKIEGNSPASRDTPVVLKALRLTKRVIVIVIGFSILFIEIAMVVLPGPAILVIPLGLGILATELLWARKLLKTIKNKFQQKKETRHAS
jgi:tellurite resistance protein TerC